MSGKAIRETLGFLAVVAGLVFVGLELRQNTAAVRAQTRQGLADRNAEFIASVMENPDLARAWDGRWSPVGSQLPTELSRTDSVQASFALMGMLRHVENVYLQFHEGVVDPTVLESYGFNRNPTFGTRQFAEYWAGVRTRFDARFVSAFEAEYGLSP